MALLEIICVEIATIVLVLGDFFTVVVALLKMFGDFMWGCSVLAGA